MAFSLSAFAQAGPTEALPIDGSFHSPRVLNVRGRLANPGFEGDRIKATLFFPGQARDGSSPYGCAITDQLGFYTGHPQDSRHLTWAASAANRDFVLQQMVQAGVNVVEMSFWGESFLPCSTGWAAYAPMQDSPQAQDELFAASIGQPLLIVPFIESRGDWTMRGEFPFWTDGRVAPGTVSQISHLIQRYLKNPSHPEWAHQWARIYDRQGTARYAVALIHAASDRLAANDHQAFAAGFDALASAVEESTAVKVGFLLDVLPPGTYAPGVLRPSPELTGSLLTATRSVLGINCFIPEIWVGSANTATLLAWKRDYIQRWSQTGLPVLVDISPGYDAHLIFGSQGAPPYGYTPDWREGLMQLVADFGAAGITYNSWNGYTEGMAAVPTREHQATFFNWLAGLPPFAVPGKIEAELFDSDGEGVSYHDQTTANEGGAFRNTSVDLESCADTGGGYNVGWMGAGEWLRYTVNVAAAGWYVIEARVASPGVGGTFHFELENGQPTSSWVIPATGGWQNWVSLRKGSIALSAGQQTLRVVMDQNAPGSIFVGNLNYLSIHPGPHLLRLTPSRERLVILCSAVPGWTYGLEFADTLSGAWRENPSSFVTASDNTVTLTDPKWREAGQRFYRVVAHP